MEKAEKLIVEIKAILAKGNGGFKSTHTCGDTWTGSGELSKSAHERYRSVNCILKAREDQLFNSTGFEAEERRALSKDKKMVSHRITGEFSQSFDQARGFPEGSKDTAQLHAAKESTEYFDHQLRTGVHYVSGGQYNPYQSVEGSISTLKYTRGEHYRDRFAYRTDLIEEARLEISNVCVSKCSRPDHPLKMSARSGAGTNLLAEMYSQHTSGVNIHDAGGIGSVTFARPSMGIISNGPRVTENSYRADKPKNMTKSKPKAFSKEDKPNPSDSSFSEQVLSSSPGRHSNHNHHSYSARQTSSEKRDTFNQGHKSIKEIFSNRHTSRANAKKTIMIIDTPDRMSHESVSDAINNVIHNTLGLGPLSSIPTKSQSSKSVPEDDYRGFRQCLSLLTRKINFKKSCPKYSRTFLREDINEKKAHQTYPDPAAFGILEQLLIDINLKKLSKALKEEMELREAAISARTRLQEQGIQTDDPPVLVDKGTDQHDLRHSIAPSENHDVACNFAPVFEANLADMQDHDEDRVEYPTAYKDEIFRQMRIKEARQLMEAQLQANKLMRDDLKLHEMKTIVKKTRPDIVEARDKFLKQKQEAKLKIQEDFMNERKRYERCTHCHLEYCRHFTCITKGLKDTDKQTLRKDRITHLYSGEDEVDEIVEVDDVMYEEAIEKSPQREGDIGDSEIGRESEPQHTLVSNPYSFSQTPGMPTISVYSTSQHSETLPKTSTKYSTSQADNSKSQAVPQRPSQPKSTSQDKPSRPQHQPPARALNIYSQQQDDLESKMKATLNKMKGVLQEISEPVEPELENEAQGRSAVVSPPNYPTYKRTEYIEVTQVEEERPERGQSRDLQRVTPREERDVNCDPYDEADSHERLVRPTATSANYPDSKRVVINIYSGNLTSGTSLATPPTSMNRKNGEYVHVGTSLKSQKLKDTLPFVHSDSKVSIGRSSTSEKKVRWK